MKRIAVSGGTGFIGQRLIPALVNESVQIRLLSRSFQPDFETVECDFLHKKIPETALEGIDTVFHLAGFSHHSRDSPKFEHYCRVLNLETTKSLITLAANSGVKRFIYVSSVKAGGVVLQGTCMTELDQVDPDDMYGKTKREAELKVLEIGRQAGIHVSIIRPALVYGAGVKGNLYMMRRSIERGWFPPVPETRNRRSMIQVDDLVSALLLVVRAEQANGEVYIAIDNVDYSTRVIYDVIRAALKKRPTTANIPSWVFGMAAWIGNHMGSGFPLDSDKLQKLLGDECYSSAKLRRLG